MKTLISISTLGLIVALAFTQLKAADNQNIDNIVQAVSAKCGEAWGADSAAAVQEYSLYREFYKQENYSDALKHWRNVFLNAPACRQTLHANGVKIYETLLKEADEASKAALADTLLAIFDIRMGCFEPTGDIMLRKAYAWYKHRGDEIGVVQELFNKSHSMLESNFDAAYLPVWIINSIKAHKKAKVIVEEGVLEVYEKIAAVSEANIAAGTNADKYQAALDKVEAQMIKYEYFTCEKLMPLAQKNYDANPDDAPTLAKWYNRLKGAKCFSEPLFLEIAIKLNEVEPNSVRSRFIASKMTEQEKYDEALQYSQQAASLEEDPAKKAGDHLSSAKLYQRKGNFSAARTEALAAADARPEWGEPYLLIGILYASSGSRCGTGTGWESQVVTWPAVDMFTRAKNLDPEVAQEAQRLINKYSSFFPTNGDCFFRNLKSGASFTVGCWINATTTVRCKKE